MTYQLNNNGISNKKASAQRNKQPSTRNGSLPNGREYFKMLVLFPGIWLEGGELVVSFINIFVIKIIPSSSSTKKTHLVLWPGFGDPVGTWRKEKKNKPFSSLLPKEGTKSVNRTWGFISPRFSYKHCDSFSPFLFSREPRGKQTQPCKDR